MMSPLTQPFLENLVTTRTPPFLVVVYFTAKWCGPCQKVGLQRIVNLRKDIQWMVCDVDTNDYSAGYCQVRSIPAWIAFVRGKPLPLLQSSDDREVCMWLSRLPTNLESPASAAATPAIEAIPRRF